MNDPIALLWRLLSRFCSITYRNASKEAAQITVSILLAILASRKPVS
jgi:hypothetical protein